MQPPLRLDSGRGQQWVPGVRTRRLGPTGRAVRRMQGILNGIDSGLWDPERDPWIPATFSAGDLAGKAACKRHARCRALRAPLGRRCPPLLQASPAPAADPLVHAEPAEAARTGLQPALPGLQGRPMQPPRYEGCAGHDKQQGAARYLQKGLGLAEGDKPLVALRDAPGAPEGGPPPRRARLRVLLSQAAGGTHPTHHRRWVAAVPSSPPAFSLATCSLCGGGVRSACCCAARSLLRLACCHARQDAEAAGVQGIPLIRHAIHRTLELGGQYLLLGTGHLDAEFRWPSRCCCAPRLTDL